MKQYSAYKKSKELQQKETDLANTLKTKPTWTGGNYQTKLADSLSNIENREKFSYDVNKDPLYQQYKDLYTSQGKLAMKDTMGQAAALTGGYGSSYASTAGNQAYQSYLTQLSSLIPELKNSARSEYDSETERLNNLYSLFSDAYNREYGEYGDKLSQWNTDRSYAYNDVNDTKNYDWSVYDSNRSDYNSVNQYNENMAYQKLRDAVADAQWQKEYDLSYYNAHKGSGGGGGGSSKTLSDKQKSALLEAWKKDGYTAGDNVDALAEEYEYLGYEDVLSALDDLQENHRKPSNIGIHAK